jgi:hypothetical protein
MANGIVKRVLMVVYHSTSGDGNKPTVVSGSFRHTDGDFGGGYAPGLKMPGALAAWPSADITRAGRR